MAPEGEDIDWTAVIRGLDWMTKYALCAGCERDGGPPKCPIRIFATIRQYLDISGLTTVIVSLSNIDKR